MTQRIVRPRRSASRRAYRIEMFSEALRHNRAAQLAQRQQPLMKVGQHIDMALALMASAVTGYCNFVFFKVDAGPVQSFKLAGSEPRKRPDCDVWQDFGRSAL